MNAMNIILARISPVKKRLQQEAQDLKVRA
jgi:hypothetical protein